MSTIITTSPSASDDALAPELVTLTATTADYFENGTSTLMLDSNSTNSDNVTQTPTTIAASRPSESNSDASSWTNNETSTATTIVASQPPESNSDATTTRTNNDNNTETLTVTTIVASQHPSENDSVAATSTDDADTASSYYDDVTYGECRDPQESSLHLQFKSGNMHRRIPELAIIAGERKRYRDDISKDLPIPTRDTSTLQHGQSEGVQYTYSNGSCPSDLLNVHLAPDLDDQINVRSICPWTLVEDVNMSR